MGETTDPAPPPQAPSGAGRRLYLDNAATTFPKPACVHEAMLGYATSVGASPGRGSYAEAGEGARLIARCRERIRRLINGASAEHIVFTLNATDALNLAIKGMVTHRRRRDPSRPIHLITTAMDHNSVLRPFNALREDGVEWTCIPADPGTGLVDPGEIARAVRRDTLLVAVVHASNVTGTVQPVGAIGAACREAGVPLLVDAAQSLGHIPVDVEAMGIDLLAFPGHKGLMGPLGTGGLYLRPGLERLVAPLREGGTGSRSDLDVHPATMPDRYEPGSHNTVGLAGLDAACGWVLERGVEAIARHGSDLVRAFLAALTGSDPLAVAGAGPRPLDRDAFPGLRLLGPPGAADRVGVFTFAHDVLSPAELAMVLEQEFGILVRAGIHCAPRAHDAVGSLAGGGGVRFSFGPFLTVHDVTYAANALSAICHEAAATA